MPNLQKLAEHESLQDAWETLCDQLTNVNGVIANVVARNPDDHLIDLVAEKARLEARLAILEKQLAKF